MKSIFSTQNLQTFFLRKYWRLPRRGPPGPPPGPPGPPSRRPPPGPPSRRGPECECPPSRRGGPPPSERWCAGADGVAAAAGAAGALPPSAAAGAEGGAACTGFCSSDITSYLSNVTIRNSVRNSGRSKDRPLQKPKRGWPKAPLHKLGGAGGLFGRSRSRGRGNRRLRHAARAAGGAPLALVRELLLALQFFVETNGLILDDRVQHAETPLKLVHQLAVIRAHLLVDVNALTVLRDLVGQLAGAPVLGLFDLAALFGDGMLDGGEDLLDFVFRRGRAGDENQIVQTFFHDDLVSFCSGRWARENRLLLPTVAATFRWPRPCDMKSAAT